MFSWSRANTTRKERLARKNAAKADPPPSVTPFVVPSPRGRVGPYISANADYADPPVFANIGMQGRSLWHDDGTYPEAGNPPDDWSGYKQSNWIESQENEHLINGDEGHKPYGYKRYHKALNPYWYLIPDSRPVRTPHEYDFRRPFDQQNKLGRRTLTGLTYPGGGTLGMTHNPSKSIQGMKPPGRGRTTYRIEPVDLSGDNRNAARSGNVFLDSNDVFSNNSYVL